jgi:hypothetical protein
MDLVCPVRFGLVWHRPPFLRRAWRTHLFAAEQPSAIVGADASLVKWPTAHLILQVIIAIAIITIIIVIIIIIIIIIIAIIIFIINYDYFVSSFKWSTATLI